MATFQYTAKTSAGEQVAGVMQAENEAAVVRTLDERQLFPIRVALQAAQRQAFGGGRIRPRDVGVIYGQLADLLRAGVPMLRTLETLGRVIVNTRLREVISGVKDDVAAGKTLADAMEARPTAFMPLHVAMVRAGERGGFLEDVLANLAVFMERQDELRGKVRGAMIYPMVLTVIGVVMVTGVLYFLVPRFRPFFHNMSLPAPTVVLFALSDLLTNYLPLLIAFIVLVFIGVRAGLRSEAGRTLWGRWKLRLPLLGKVTRMVSITRFCRILGTMLANGVPILQALAISKDATGSVVMAEMIEKAAENVRAGQKLHEPLKEGGVFPAEVIEMIAVGEESNQLEKVLVQIADTVERRTARQVDQAVRLIEPLILVVMAVAIGFVAIGLLYPIFTMSQTIR